MRYLGDQESLRTWLHWGLCYLNIFMALCGPDFPRSLCRHTRAEAASTPHPCYMDLLPSQAEPPSSLFWTHWRKSWCSEPPLPFACVLRSHPPAPCLQYLLAWAWRIQACRVTGKFGSFMDSLGWREGTSLPCFRQQFRTCIFIRRLELWFSTATPPRNLPSNFDLLLLF